MRKTAVVLLIPLAACSDGRPVPTAPPAPAATRDGRWEQDVDYLASELPRLHPNLFFRTPRAEFDRVVAEVRQAVPRSPDFEVALGLMRIAALPGDAHTAVRPWAGLDRLPLRLEWLSGGLYVTGAGAGLEPALGGRVVAFGERTVEELEHAASAFVSYENEAWRRLQVAQALTLTELLHVLGASQEPMRVRLWLEDAGGARLALDVSGTTAPARLVDLTTAAGSSLPLHRQRQDAFYWFTTIEPSGTLYLQYNRCRDGPERFRDFAERVFRELDGGGVDRLVVDVRHNVGGDSRVDDPLIDGLRDRPSWRSRGRLFALVSGETFSSGMWTAQDLQAAGAVLVGSPTGGKPNSYGDTRTLSLPNSRIEVSYSTTFFRRADGDPPSILPAVPVQPTIDDVRAGRDPLLEAALAFR